MEQPNNVVKTGKDPLMPHDSLGEFEKLVMMAVLHLGSEVV